MENFLIKNNVYWWFKNMSRSEAKAIAENNGGKF